MQTDTTLFTNGRIYRSAFSPAVSAMQISGGKVQWIGDRKDAPASSRTVDLAGAALLPGLTDAHVHLLWIAQNTLQLSLMRPDIVSLRDLLEDIRKRVAETPRGNWVNASDLNEMRLEEKRLPTRQELDAFSPDHPVLVRRYCGHSAVVNSRAMRLLGLDDATPDPTGGHFGRDAQGRLDGSAHETAAEMIFSRSSSVADGDLEQALIEVMHSCSQLGFVAAVEAAVGFTNGFENEHRVWAGLRDRMTPLFRLGFMAQLRANDARARGLRPDPDPHWQTITLKYFADGIVGGRTAAVSEPFEDTGTTGYFALPEDVLADEIKEAHRDGWQVAVHAIGDRAIDCVISAYEDAQTRFPRNDPRHRIEHFFVPPAGGLARMHAAGALVVMQPGFISRFNHSIRSGLGSRCDFAYPGRSVLDRGAGYVGSSDAPTGILNPWQNMVAAVDRCKRQGAELGPAESVSLREAFDSYSRAGAVAMHQDHWRGTLDVGRAADFIVTETDPFEATLDAVEGLSVAATFLDGEVQSGSL